MTTPAATVVALRDGPSGLEVLLLRRNSRGPFGGMWVFPGGKVDPDDLVEPEPDTASEEPLDLRAARRAAVREAHEEACLRLAGSDLIVHSFWMPPPETPRRFATWFFLAVVADGDEVTVDQSEIRDHRWVTPSRALELRDEGEIELAPPTYVTLWWLSHHPATASAMEAATAGPVDRYETHLAGVGEKWMTAMWDGDAGYDDGDVDRPGPRRRLVMDPAGWRVEIGP